MSYLDEMFGLSGQTVVVTGGAGVIGTAMSKTFLKAGANVVIWDRSQEYLDEAMDRLKDHADSRLKGLLSDTGDESAVESTLKESVELFGQVDILVNGVGGNIGKAPFIETDMEQFTQVLHMNLVAGLVVPTKVFAKYWIDNDIKGNIINMASMTSYKPLSGVWAYDAAKAGVYNLTMGTANEFAPYGIRVNAIAPGFFVGKQNKDLLIDKETGGYTERGQSVIDLTPYKRFGDIDELAGATLFLASNKASGFATGISIPVDGGYLIHNI
ncbi:MAG: SDR family oxidoreductase [Proteobacteria bacterium]|nr:SDR family oxidoreductase [Pseudomonadota bacterium]